MLPQVWETAAGLAPAFTQIDHLVAHNLRRMQAAMRRARLGPHHFAGSSGYGHGDLGRAALDQVTHALDVSTLWMHANSWLAIYCEVQGAARTLHLAIRMHAGIISTGALLDARVAHTKLWVAILCTDHGGGDGRRGSRDAHPVRVRHACHCNRPLLGAQVSIDKSRFIWYNLALLRLCEGKTIHIETIRNITVMRSVGYIFRQGLT